MGREGFEPSKPKQQIYSLPPLTTREPPRKKNRQAICRIRTDDPEITNHVLWPAELRWRSRLHSASSKGKITPRGQKCQQGGCWIQSGEPRICVPCLISSNVTSKCADGSPSAVTAEPSPAMRIFPLPEVRIGSAV